MTCEENVRKAKQEVREEITKSLIGILAVPVIAETTGVELQKVQEFRLAYGKRLYGEKKTKKEIKIPYSIRKTRLKGETKLSKMNKEALEKIRSFRGSFG